LQAEINRSRRYKHSLTLAYIDLDNFKQVNDRFGHSTGDLLLKLIVEIASQNIRNTDLFGRMGGDEFVLLLPETNYQAARIVLTRVQQDLLKTMTERSWPVGFSIGAITFINQPNSSEAMLERVDKLMYQVKNSGKNRIEHNLFE
jgi:diguanylate cyclase (GGDEF)-like protein